MGHCDIMERVSCFVFQTPNNSDVAGVDSDNNYISCSGPADRQQLIGTIEKKEF